MQRTRVRGSIVSRPYSWVQYSRTWNSTTKDWNPEYVSKNTTQASSSGMAETITDIYRKAPKQRRYFEDVLPVSHDKFEMTLGRGGGYKGWYYANSSKTLQSRNNYAQYGVSESVARSYLPAFPTPSSLLHKEAADQFEAGGVATETSLPNFLLELGEIKGLLSLLNPRRLKEAFSGKHGDKEISGGFLAYNFGIKPLLGDLAVIAAYTTNLQKRLEWLLKNKGKTVSLDFRKPLTTVVKNTLPPGTTSGLYVTWAEYSAYYHAFCRWKVDYDPVKQAWEKLKYFNRYFGTSQLLQAAWNGIPYSFVLDWVSNLGGLITQFSLPSTLSSNLTGVGYAVKDMGLYSIGAGWLVSYNPGATCNASKVSFKRYRRYPGLPLSITTAFDTSTATGRQQALAMALIHQKIR